jgi:hypothetical protein
MLISSKTTEKLNKVEYIELIIGITVLNVANAVIIKMYAIKVIRINPHNNNL